MKAWFNASPSRGSGTGGGGSSRSDNQATPRAGSASAFSSSTSYRPGDSSRAAATALQSPPPGYAGDGEDEEDDTIKRGNGDTSKKKKSNRKGAAAKGSVEEQLEAAKEQIKIEKAGKRKLFHSLVKLANELRRTKQETQPLLEHQSYANRAWHEGGLWRNRPAVLPGVTATTSSGKPQHGHHHHHRAALSLSSLFFQLVIVTGLTRVGAVVSLHGHLDWNTTLYFATIWTIWSKEAAYSTRFDCSDVSAQLATLLVCFGVLFCSLSVAAPLQSVDGTRIMMLAAGVAVLHCLLHLRLALTVVPPSTTAADTMTNTAAASATADASDEASTSSSHLSTTASGAVGIASSPSTKSAVAPPAILLVREIRNYAIFNLVMNFSEATVWFVGVLAMPVDWTYRWALFVGAILLAMRLPRAFLANDFHAACSKRGVLFILLLGFLLQSLVVVASEFFEYQTPTLEHYAFLGAACLMLFSIKLLYVDDADTNAQDHALLVNRPASFFFSVGHFALLLSTTVLGSGLNLLTHDYLAATAALPGPAKTLVVGGFAATIFSTFFIKSMHLKRIPLDRPNQIFFIGAYVIQTAVLLAVVAVCTLMCLGHAGPFLNSLMDTTEIELLFCLCAAALLVVVCSWLDNVMELVLYQNISDSRAFRIQPFGFWWCCLQPDVTQEEIFESAATAANADDSMDAGSAVTDRLSVMSPLLGSSMAQLKSAAGYDALTSEEV